MWSVRPRVTGFPVTEYYVKTKGMKSRKQTVKVLWQKAIFYLSLLGISLGVWRSWGSEVRLYYPLTPRQPPPAGISHARCSAVASSTLSVSAAELLVLSGVVMS